MQAAETTTTSAARKEAPGVLKRSSRFYIDPTTIAVDPAWNNRVDMGDLDSLAESIKHELERDSESGGLLEEIGVQRIDAKHPLAEGGAKLFVLRWGHRRTAAIAKLMAKGVKFPTGVPAKIVDKAQDIQASKIQMIAENTGQKPLLPLEEAAGYKQLRDGWPELGIKGMSIKEICKAVGRAQPHVTEMLALLEADDSVKEAVQSGAIGKQTAKVIAKQAKGDKEAQKQLVAAAKQAKGKRGGASAVRLAAENTKRAKAGKKLKMRALTDAQLAKLGTTVAQDLIAKMKDAGFAQRGGRTDQTISQLREWIAKDDKLALAFVAGSLEGLRAAAGMKVELSL